MQALSQLSYTPRIGKFYNYLLLLTEDSNYRAYFSAFAVFR